jgi:hypothetical protein
MSVIATKACGHPRGSRCLCKIEECIFGGHPKDCTCYRLTQYNPPQESQMLEPKCKITIEQVHNGFVVMPGPSYRNGGSLEHCDANDVSVYTDLTALNRFLFEHFNPVQQSVAGQSKGTKTPQWLVKMYLKSKWVGDNNDKIEQVAFGLTEIEARDSLFKMYAEGRELQSWEAQRITDKHPMWVKS